MEETVPVIDIDEKCSENELDWKLDYEIGYGRTYDSRGIIYAVKVYFTHQKSK